VVGGQLVPQVTRVSTDNVLVVRAKWKMDKIFEGGGAPDPVVQVPVAGHLTGPGRPGLPAFPGLPPEARDDQDPTGS